MLSRVSELQKGYGSAAEMSLEERAEVLNDLFLNELVPFLREVNVAVIDAQVEEQLYYQQTLEFQNRGQKAELIRQKYETITREFNGQNKQFQERHAEICVEEVSKREQILKNFDEHLVTIRSQMSEDVAKSREENELIRQETETLQAQYADLYAECTEKKELMQKQLAEQESKTSNIEETLHSQITTQAEELKKNVEVYRENTKIKLEEEKQLLKVLTDYKGKFKEFQKATKSSK